MSHCGRLDSVTSAMCCMSAGPVRANWGLGGCNVGPPGLGGRPLFFFTGAS